MFGEFCPIGLVIICECVFRVVCFESGGDASGDENGKMIRRELVDC